jgi:protein-S-isoprenylcysteine O-methyltransferase Ste14
MYVSMALLQTSVGLAVDSLWVVLLWLPALIVVHYTAVLPEEKYLSERFGEAYQRYAASVRRYL